MSQIYSPSHWRDESWQNAPGEHSYLTIAYLVTAMLHDADLEFKYWPRYSAIASFFTKYFRMVIGASPWSG
jgi:hypothetical protein